ncbi:WD40/YVTN/BNR-like repeat-containing protein [Granulicella sibirica]|nr:sialidase family protein [Granulicella sibirica]
MAVNWLPYGPDGGDARAFAMDPSNHAHLYLGAVNGWVYESFDSGKRWRRLARVGMRDDLVLDNIVVDASNPKHVMVGAWVLGQDGGGLFQSQDGGAHWAEQEQMKGQSIRSLTAAPSNPKLVIAGTLKGVFRTKDSGQHWDLISPPENREIHEVESVAIDPVNPDVIYIGTWHLPWRSLDGGANWTNMKQGIIEDSDVFSIIVDPKTPKTMFASACSGIYKSDNGGEMFHKVQGIPSTARRTRVLMQDPGHLDTVFAGTTEGLFRTMDSGKTWIRTTGPEVIINDVFVDPTDTKHVMLATDRGGVLISEDGGNSFAASNTGFSARQITAFQEDGQKSGVLYAGVVNDKEWGGVFMSQDGGLSWAQRSDGLGGRDVFGLGQAADGTIVAGTGHGLFYQAGAWTKASVKETPIEVEVPVKVVAKKGVRKGATPAKPTVRKVIAKPTYSPDELDGRVYGIATVGDKMFAGTSSGMLLSVDSGRTWMTVPALGKDELRFVAAEKQTIVAAGLARIMLSTDGGETWTQVTTPSAVTQVSALAVDGRGEIWVGGREGVYLSSDKGSSWQTLRNLYVRDVDSLYYDRQADQVLVTANGEATIAFAVKVSDRKVSFWDTGWTLRFVRPVGDHLLGATLYDGVVIQPRMVESAAR